MKIAFILDHRLHHYRAPFFKELAEKGYEIDIYHTGPEIEIEIGSVNQIIVKSTKVFKAFEWFKLPNLNSYDVVVVMQNIRLLNLWSLSFNFRRKYKLIHWGIGVSSSKGLPKNKTLISRVRDKLSNFSDAIVFYSAYPLQFFSIKNQSKSFIAHNTVFNLLFKDMSTLEKDSFLFVGSINKRKGLDVLLRSFSNYLKEDGSIQTLNIVGGGDKEIIEELKASVIKEKLENNIKFIGPVYSDEVKQKYFEKAVCSISPKQAGLSVLESFSYGVPFICFEDAISGGEHLNIKNDVNGYLVNSEDELTAKLMLFTDKSNLSKDLGRSAYEFYRDKRSMAVMVDEFDKAIQFVLKSV